MRLSRIEKKILTMRADGLTINTISSYSKMSRQEVKNIFINIAKRIKSSSDSAHILKIIQDRKKPQFIDYRTFTYKGKPLTQLDIWSIMCKYHTKHPEDKKFNKLIELGERIL